jgi:hypothetical protein
LQTDDNLPEVRPLFRLNFQILIWTRVASNILGLVGLGRPRIVVYRCRADCITLSGLFSMRLRVVPEACPDQDGTTLSQRREVMGDACVRIASPRKGYWLQRDAHAKAPNKKAASEIPT